MERLKKGITLLNRVTVVTISVLILVLLMAYGGMITANWIRGHRVGNYMVADVYTFGRLAFSCGGLVLEASEGSLTTAVRNGSRDYAVLEGDIRVEWPEPVSTWRTPPPNRVARLRMSMHPDDLDRLMTRNSGALEKLLEYEGRAMAIKELAVKKGFEWGADRSQQGALPAVEFYIPPAEDSMDLAILLDAEGKETGWTLTVGEQPPRPPSTRTSALLRGTSSQLFALSPLLAILVVASACLATLGRAAYWIGTLTRQPSRFLDGPVSQALSAVAIVATAAAVLSILLLT